MLQNITCQWLNLVHFSLHALKSISVQCKHADGLPWCVGSTRLCLWLFSCGPVWACGTCIQRISSLTAVSSCCCGRLFLALRCVISEEVMLWAAWCLLTRQASPAQSPPLTLTQHMHTCLHTNLFYLGTEEHASAITTCSPVASSTLSSSWMK